MIKAMSQDAIHRHSANSGSPCFTHDSGLNSMPNGLPKSPPSGSSANYILALF